MQRIASRAPARASSTRHIQALILGIVALGLTGAAHASQPTVTRVSSTTANGTYGEGATIVLTVQFSESVDVTSNGNNAPKLALNSAGLAIGKYFDGSGSDTLTFHYLVAKNDSTGDLNYVSTGALTNGGGTIVGSTGSTPALLTLPATNDPTNSLGGNKSIVIDASSPVVTIVSSTKASGSYKAGEVIPITVTFNRAVTVTSSGNAQPYITLETGTTDTNVDYTSGSGTAILQFDYTVKAGDTSSDLDYISTTALNVNSGTIKDVNGNSATLTLASPASANSLGSSKNIVIDTTAPTVTSVTTTAADGTYGIGAVIPIKVTFSEAVTVTSNANLTLETGTTDAVVNYSSGTGTTVLLFNYTVQSGHAAGDLDYAATTSLVTQGSIKDAAGNDATLTLATPGAANSISVTKAIVIDTTPTITQVQPAQGPETGTNVVTIIGKNFSSVSDVKFGATSATAFVETSSTTISAQVPAGTGVVAVSVTSAAGTGNKASAYTYLAAPTVTSVSPAKGPTAGGKTVTITGTNFSNVLVVKIDGVPVSSYTVTNATTISAVTPAHAATTSPVAISVTTSGGTGSGGSYSYLAAPTITSLNKTSGPIDGTQTVIITGTNFDTTNDGNTVTFGGTAVTSVAEDSDTQLTVVTAAHAAGLVDVVVTAPGGTATKAKSYTYIGLPTITSIAPDEGDVGGGTAITIAGTNLTGVTKVTIGGAAATNMVVVGATKITCTTPAGTAGAATVAFEAPDRDVANAGTYTYGDKPSISTTSLPDGELKSAYTATTLQATGSPTFKAVGLPAGLKLNAATGEITGAPSKTGSFAVQVTATNSFGSDNAVLTIKVTNPDAGTNVAPELVSQPFAFPNPAITNEKVTFTAAATDSNKDNLSFVWTIKDSNGAEVAKVAGASTSYTFTTADAYTVDLVVDDGAATVTGSLSINVGGLSVASAALKFNFKSTNKDNLKVGGTLSGLKDYVPADQQVSFTVSNSAYTMTLNAKGVSSGDKTQTFALSGKLDKTTGAYTTDTAKFTASLVNKDLLSQLSDLGFVNADVLKPGAQITLPIFVSINGKSYNANIQVIYTAKQNSAGTGAIKKK